MKCELVCCVSSWCALGMLNHQSSPSIEVKQGQDPWKNRTLKDNRKILIKKKKTEDKEVPGCL